jgi:hypothetical protein
VSYAYEEVQVERFFWSWNDGANSEDFEFDSSESDWIRIGGPGPYLLTGPGTLSSNSDVNTTEGYLSLNIEDAGTSMGGDTQVMLNANPVVDGSDNHSSVIYFNYPGPMVTGEKLNLSISDPDTGGMLVLNPPEEGGPYWICFYVWWDGGNQRFEQDIFDFPTEWQANEQVVLRLDTIDCEGGKTLKAYYYIGTGAPEPTSENGWTGSYTYDGPIEGWSNNDHVIGFAVAFNPEPTTVLMFLSGIFGLGWKLKKKRRV